MVTKKDDMLVRSIPGFGLWRAAMRTLNARATKTVGFRGRTTGGLRTTLVFGAALGLGIFPLLAFPALANSLDTILGAGSSAASPIYHTWASGYERAKGGGKVSYDPIGSTGGVVKIRAREVDFGGSDVAPSPDELGRDRLVAVPTAISGVVPIYNLPDLKGTLVLSGPVLARIFLGDITRWDAKEIRELNPQLRLPALAISPVVRADGSGTNYNFTDYLSKIDPAWRKRHGVAYSVKWPEQFAARKGSEAMSEDVRATPGAIGYVDHNYVIEDKLSQAKMVNAEGRVVTASPESFRAAVRASDWQKKGDFSQPLTNQGGKDSWPLTMGTFVLLPKVATHPEQTQRVIQFFTWAFLHGDELADHTNFVRLPDAVQAKAFRILTSITDRDGHLLAYESLK